MQQLLSLELGVCEAEVRLSKMKDGDADGVAVRIPGIAAVGRRRRILILTIAVAISFCRDV